MGKIIACLDVKDRKVVKGKMFEQIKEVDDPLNLAIRYEEEGCDELYYYDISASSEDRGTYYDQIKAIKNHITMPFTVGGGIHELKNIKELLNLGVDKVSINTGAINNPKLISDAAKKYGKKRIVAAIDYKKVGNNYFIYTRGGQEKTELDAIQWAKKLEHLGAGEICCNSIDGDGMRNGFDLEFLNKLRNEIKIPIIASGGAGRAKDFIDVFNLGIEKALAASIFHFELVNIKSIQEAQIESLHFNEKDLIPAILQDAKTKKVLMLAYMNKESLKKTINTGNAWFYSRSRQKLWMKGEESGNTQKIIRIDFDCDKDALLCTVQPKGPACHTGRQSCFYQNLVEKEESVDRQILFKEYDRIMERFKNPKNGYTDYLLREGIDKILKKIGEESAETIIAAKNNSKEEIIYEMSDLLYHLNVLLVEREISLDDIMKEISRRYE